ncbi:MAG: methionyl-tRNA formyltransferase [Pyrinomonadaceae bacterium]
MRIVFMGTPAAAIPSLRRCSEDQHEVVAVWTQPDKPAGRGKKLSIPPIKEFALERGLEVYQPPRLKIPFARELFASHRADVAIVVAYGRILPDDYLRTPARGCINVHFSLLPFYRGAAPVNWAIVNGETQTGVTTMFIQPELDSGPILLQSKTPIGPRETAPQLMERLADMGADLLGETLKHLNELTPRPQHDRDATFAPLLRKEDGLIDWSQSSFQIQCAVRGFQPWPNAHTTFRSHGLTVWEARPILESAVAEPGVVLVAKGQTLLVKCGAGTALELLEVQPEAKRRMSMRDFLNGVHLEVGEKFGDS